MPLDEDGSRVGTAADGDEMYENGSNSSVFWVRVQTFVQGCFKVCPWPVTREPGDNVKLRLCMTAGLEDHLREQHGDPASFSSFAVLLRTALMCAGMCVFRGCITGNSKLEHVLGFDRQA